MDSKDGKISLRRAFLLGVAVIAASTAGVHAQATTTLLGIPVPTPTPKPHSRKRLPLPDVFGNQPHAPPLATPEPGELSVYTKFRMYDFQRLNAVQTEAAVNRHSLEFAAAPHLDYRFGDSGFNLGYTYFGATGFGFNGPNPIANAHADNTLPGYPLNSPVHELYLQYKDANQYYSVGNQELNYPWMPNNDTRIKPSSYQAIDATIKASQVFSLSLTREFRFEWRSSSNFESNTVLTAAYPQTEPPVSNPFTPGTLRLGVNYHPSPQFVLSTENYQFYSIADLFYTEAKWGFNPYSRTNPYIAMQYVAENSLQPAEVGIIDNHTIGAQLGANLVKNVLFAASTDIAPWKYAYVNAPSAAAATSGYFVGGGGTGTVLQYGPNLYKVAYGGIASPYTDAVGSDAMYTSQMTQGMVDRRSAGNMYKMAMVYTAPSKQFKLIADESWFQFSNDISRNLTSEFDLDGTYFFNKVRPGAYHGLMARVRIGPRNQPTAPYHFEYQRFMVEYDL